MGVIERARNGGGPSLIACPACRHSGQSRADPRKYLPPGELEKWMERDPLKTCKRRLAEFGISERDAVAIKTESRRKVEEATERCKASPPCPVELLTADVYPDGGWAWRN